MVTRGVLVLKKPLRTKGWVPFQTHKLLGLEVFSCGHGTTDVAATATCRIIVRIFLHLRCPLVSGAGHGERARRSGPDPSNAVQNSAIGDGGIACETARGLKIQEI